MSGADDARGSPHPAALDDEALLRACRITHSRSGGPGGQHRNKVETAVTVEHTATGISAAATERRSRQENLRVALRRLRVRLAVGVRGERSAAAVPSELWRGRCSGGVVRVNAEHRDAPALLAEALDVLAMCDWDARGAAERLACSTTQLVGLLKTERAAFDTLNAERVDRGLRPLR